ncbi:uncharacterized protein BCR38DRAFT_459530 [Pseudomassariella vexata]|uniref:Formylmethionine deformylase-like protein n=1 Tax=Pseudomassariella vexata TaxID=1141098 RepID=A0A1Y2DR55_9PEZI|nr:uncharacterized protein BCR38DRAFT_459530 [Pseudomassariella vexata]ORY61740.1 hypothetical protein BCR38DRAFT_459530 [Pseudomassariella vexata]
MYVFFAFGVCCAVGHHLFYSAFNGRPADNLIVMLRYGTILAFAAKAGLAAAAITAFRQRIWTTVRSKLLSVAALDSLFAATEDLAALLNLEIYKSATLAMVLAVFIWLTPLVIILTSNTLTVELAFFEEKGMCPGVKTLNFTMESLENWRLAKKINGLFGISTSLYNTTATNISDPYWFDYYTGPSMGFAQVATLGMFSQQAMQPKDAGLEICGPGWNCTYVVNFTAPGYQCSDIASGVNSRMNKLGNNTAPFDTSILLPEGNFSYYAYTSGGDYSPTQLKPEYIDVGGVPIGIEPPWPHHFGALRTEPILWIGHSVRTNKTDPTPNNRTEPGWDDAFTPKIFACEHYETHYTVSFNWTGGQQFSNVMKREYLKPVIDTTFIPSVKAMDGTNDNTTAYPESNYWYPSADQTEMQPYRRVAAFHSIGAVLRDFINGTVNSESILNPIAVGKAIQTKVLDPRSEYFPHSELAPIIQEVYEDVILSMFSDPRFLAIVWAQKPWEKSGTLPGDESTAYPCNRSRDVVVYKYVARDLWIVYSLAFVFSMIAIGLGTAAVLENEGVLRNTRFSSIVAATRGPALERVMWREERGDVPRDIKNLKVGYGIVHRANALGVTEDTRYPERTLWDGGEIRYGFGLEGDVRQVK